MSLTENERLARASRWLWLALGGLTAVAIVVAAIVVQRLTANRVAAVTPIMRVPEPESPPLEAETHSAVVTFPRQPGNVGVGDGEESSEQTVTVSPSPSPEETQSAATSSVEARSETEAKIPPRPRSTTAVGLLASINRPSETVANADADDKQPQSPTKSPSVERDRPADAARGPDPTYAPAKTSADAAILAQFEKLIREMLELGWTAKASGLKQAEEKLNAVVELCPEDPRATFAYGLVLLKHSQYDQAIKRFDSIGEMAKPPYLPAFRGTIWIRILRKDYEPAVLDLVNLTRAWQAIELGPLPEWVQDDYVAWTGRMVGFLDGPVDNRSVDALLEKCVAEIGGLLSRPQLDLFKAARNDVLDEFAAKANAQDQARLEAKRQQEKAAEETKARLTEEASATKTEKKQVEKSAEELEKSLKAEVAAIDNQFNGLAREYDRLDLRARNVSNYIRAIDQEIATLINQRTQLQVEQNPPPSGTGNDPKKTGTSKTPPQPSSTNTQQILVISATIDLRNRDRLRYQADYDRLEIQARDVQRQGTALLSRRQSLINDYQTTTGKLYKEKESLAAKEKFLERRKQEVSKPATGSTGQVKALGQTAKALRTYVDFNLELEKQRLLDSFAKP